MRPGEAVHDPERHRRLREAFEAVLETDSVDRPGLIAEICGCDQGLRRDLEVLLEAHESGAGLTDRPAARAVQDLLDTAGEADPSRETLASASRRIGPYRLVERIAVGGMGAVYRADRADGGFDQTVAIKILPLGRDSDGLLRRFESERRILAGLHHPNIARLFDGGTTDDGLPYIVMEYVEGRPIDRYCDEERLSVDERLELFLAVCEAVQAAHRALIVHRDLKPSNILVTGDGAPKLLDFGIAKPFDPESTGSAPLVTMTSMRPMTPAYASPEQVQGEQVTTASDVYSLGVILYELLAGRRPYEPTTTAAALERAIVETEPEPPSGAVGKEAAERTTSTLDRLRRRLRGDLDNIVLEALRKEPERRYGSVAELAADVRRHRTGHPITARADTFAYRARKFVRRNSVGVATAAVVVLALLGGIGATLDQARKANDQREKAEATAEFLEDVLSMAGAGWMTAADRAGPDVTVAEAVDRAAAEAGDRLGHLPDVEARIRRTLAMTYFFLGRYEDAREQAATALGRDRVAFPDGRDIAIGRDLALLADADHLLGRFDAAEPGYRQAIEIFEATLAEPDTLHIATVNNLGLLLWRRGEPVSAEPYLRQALEMNRRRYGEDHPVVAITLGNLGLVCDAHGDLECAERMYRQSLAVWERVPGREHMERGASLTNLGRILSLAGRSGAEPFLTEALDLWSRTLGEEHEFIAVALTNLADHHVRAGEIALAGREIRRAAEIVTARLPDGHPHVGRVDVGFARVLLAEGSAAEAETRARAALGTLEEVVGPTDSRTADARLVLGGSLAAQGRRAEAVAVLERARTDLTAALGADHPLAAEARRELERFREDGNAPGSNASRAGPQGG